MTPHWDPLKGSFYSEPSKYTLNFTDLLVSLIFMWESQDRALTRIYFHFLFEISFVKLLDYARIGALVVAWTAADQKALEKFKSKENENFNIEILTSEELAEITPGMSDVSVNRMQANAIVRPLYKIKTRNLECYKCLST